MDNFLLILIYLCIGMLARRIPKFTDDTPVVLNAFVLYIALPALILQKIPALTFSTALLIPAVVPWILLLIVVATVLLLSRIFGWSREVTAALLIVLPLGNTSFLGFPMIEAFFGGDHLPYALIYDQVGSFVALATYSTILAAAYSPSAEQATLKSMSLKIVTFPPFLALMLALLLRNFSYPPLFQALIDNLAATLVPLIMVAVGFTLRFSLGGERLSPLLSGITIKLVLMPLLVYAGCYALGLEGKAVTVSVFEAAMPPMISAGAIAIMAGLAPRMVANLVGFGLLVSFITLPLWYWLLQI
ncbi:AEC family transporter [Rheinheimera riviphila]|uniref:AEC family transporter n=1 Tax=Rheinheimera riviphila TaxID=1834037 RepID=A0A437QF84_9GAMM|nr:AEC family transporter [Rheinheimera riviphila]RVU33182.1 AEC family transporter [Rheinheimera riviphila]